MINIIKSLKKRIRENIISKNGLFSATSSFWLFIILFLTLLATVWIFNRIITKQMVCWDEGNHLYVGNTVRQAIEKKDWQKFWQLTLNQRHYPFLQSWFLGFFSFPWEYTIEHARLISFLLIFPSLILVWSIGKNIGRNVLAAPIASFLFISSPYLLLLFSMVLKEGFGIFLALLIFRSYLRSREQNNNFNFLLTGFLLFLMMMTKYNFGVLVLGGLGLESIFWLISEKKYLEKKYWLANILLYLPMILGMVIWVLIHPQPNEFKEIVFAFRQFLVPGPGENFNLYETDFLGHLLYYPRELAYVYTFSPLAFLLLVFGFIFSVKNWGNYRLRVLGLFFLVNFFAASKQMVNNQGRYIALCVPFFFLVGTYGATNYFELIIRSKIIKKVKLRPLFFGLLISFIVTAFSLLVHDLVTFSRYLPGIASHEILSAVFYQQDYLPNGKHVSTFDFDRESWPKIPPPPNVEKIPEVMKFILSNVEINKNLNFAGFLNEFSPGITFFYIDKAREKNISGRATTNFSDYFVAITVEDGSRFDTYVYRIYTRLLPFFQAKQILNDKSLTRITEKFFPYLGLTVSIFGR